MCDSQLYFLWSTKGDPRYATRYVQSEMSQPSLHADNTWWQNKSIKNVPPVRAGGPLPSRLFSSSSPMLHWLKDWVLKKYLLILTEAPSGIKFLHSFPGRPGHRQLHKICLEFCLGGKNKRGRWNQENFLPSVCHDSLFYECIGLDFHGSEGANFVCAVAQMWDITLFTK